MLYVVYNQQINAAIQIILVVIQHFSLQFHPNFQMFGCWMLLVGCSNVPFKHVSLYYSFLVFKSCFP